MPVDGTVAELSVTGQNEAKKPLQTKHTLVLRLSDKNIAEMCESVRMRR